MVNQLPSQKGGRALQFSVHFYFGQTAECIRMPLGMEVGLGLCDIVFDVDPATPRKKGTPTPTQFLAHTPLGTEVYHGPGHTVLDRVPAPAKGAQHPLLRPMSIVATVAHLSYC